MSEKFLKVLNVVNNKLNPPKERKVTDINGLVEGVDIKKLTPSFTNLRGINIEKIGVCNIYNPKKNKKLFKFIDYYINLNGIFLVKNILYGFVGSTIFKIDFCTLTMIEILKINEKIKMITEFNGDLIIASKKCIYVYDKKFQLLNFYDLKDDIDNEISSITEFNGDLIIASKKCIYVYDKKFQLLNFYDLKDDIDNEISSITEFNGDLIIASILGRLLVFNSEFKKINEKTLNNKVFYINSYNEFLIVCSTNLIYFMDKKLNLKRKKIFFPSNINEYVDIISFYNIGKLIVINKRNNLNEINYLELYNENLDNIISSLNKKIENIFTICFCKDFLIIGFEKVIKVYDKKFSLITEYNIEFKYKLQIIEFHDNILILKDKKIEIIKLFEDKKFFQKFLEKQFDFAIESFLKNDNDLIVYGEKIVVINDEFKVKKEVDLGFYVKHLKKIKDFFIIGDKEKLGIYNKSFEEIAIHNFNFEIIKVSTFNETIIITERKLIRIYDENFNLKGKYYLKNRIRDIYINKNNIFLCYDGLIEMIEIKILNDLVVNKIKEIYFFNNCIEKIDFVNNKIEIVSYSDDNLQVFYDYGKVLSEDGEVVAYYELDKKYWEIKDNVLTIKKDK